MTEPKEYRPSSYPTDEQIKPEWTSVHTLLIVVSGLIWPAFYFFSSDHTLPKILTLLGLQLGIIGSVLSSLKTPVYGSFVDGGKLNIKRAKVEGVWWQRGMLLIATGFIAQVCALLIV